MPSEKRTCPCKQLPMCLSSFTAAEYGDLHSLERSMKSARLSSVNRVDSGGYTPLHLAAQNGHVAATSLLLQLGAKPDSSDCGATPLHRASYSGAISTMNVLLEEKWHCDLLAKDSSFGDGMTVLHKASAGGRYLAVKLLIDVLRERQTPDESNSMLRQALEALDSLKRTPLDVALELVQNEEEERQSVRRWDAVAGGAADWQQCIQLLKAAENEIRQGLSTKRTRLITLPALPKHLSKGASCFDCDTSGDGVCLTASWESAFRSALSSSIVDTQSNTVSSSDLKNRATSTEEPVEKQARDDAAPAVEMECEPDVGQKCESCGVRSFALYPSTKGTLVCRSCSKPRRRVLR